MDAQLVKAELAGKATAAQVSALEADLDGWRKALASLLTEGQAALATRRTQMQNFERECRKGGPRDAHRLQAARVDYERWRTGLVALINRAQTRISEVNRAIADRNRADTEASAAAALHQLYKQIDEHADLTRSYGLEPSDADLALWRLAAELRERDTTSADVIDLVGADAARRASMSAAS